MAPKEHGAWGQLGFPLLVAMGLNHSGLAAMALALAAVALFLAHEPLVVLLGQRGTRAVREAAGPAKRRLVWLTATAALLGIGALATSTWEVRWAAIGTLGLVLVALFGFLAQGQERSTLGEIWIAWTLPSAALSVALAGKVPLSDAIGCWLSFSLAYSAGVFGVRGIIEDYRERRAGAGWFGLVGVLIAIVVLGTQQRASAAAALVYWLVVASCRASRPTPKSLRRIGWILVATSVVHAVWLIAALR